MEMGPKQFNLFCLGFPEIQKNSLHVWKSRLDLCIALVCRMFSLFPRPAISHFSCKAGLVLHLFPRGVDQLWWVLSRIWWSSWYLNFTASKVSQGSHGTQAALWIQRSRVPFQYFCTLPLDTCFIFLVIPLFLCMTCKNVSYTVHQEWPSTMCRNLPREKGACCTMHYTNTSGFSWKLSNVSAAILYTLT